MLSRRMLLRMMLACMTEVTRDCFTGKQLFLWTSVLKIIHANSHFLSTVRFLDFHVRLDLKPLGTVWNKSQIIEFIYVPIEINMPVEFYGFTEVFFLRIKGLKCGCTSAVFFPLMFPTGEKQNVNFRTQYWQIHVLYKLATVLKSSTRKATVVE